MAHGNRIYGWFDDASQKATSEPPLDAICLYCGHSINPDDVRTHNIMYPGQYAARGYFYRTHRTCDERDGTGTGADGWVLDMIARNGD